MKRVNKLMWVVVAVIVIVAIGAAWYLGYI